MKREDINTTDPKHTNYHVWMEDRSFIEDNKDKFAVIKNIKKGE